MTLGKYKLTSGSLMRMHFLEEFELPWSVLKSLETLKNQEFKDKAELEDTLKNTIGKDLLENHERVILKYADKSNQKVIFLNSLLFDLSYDNLIPKGEPNIRFGKVEKFILSYSLKYFTNMKGFGGNSSLHQFMSDEDGNHVSFKEWAESKIILRRNMVLKYYQYSSKDKSHIYKKNLKKYMHSGQYNSIQSIITRSICSLEKKGMVRFFSNSNTLSSYYGTHARKAFTLTYLGLFKAFDLLIKIYEKGDDSLRWSEK